MYVVLQAQMKGCQNHAEELLTHKDLECQQTVEQLEAHFQALINEKGGQVGLPQTSSKR